MNLSLLLFGHNLLTWVIVLSGLTALAHALQGYRSGRAWRVGDRIPGLVLTALVNFQFVLGLMIFYNSPLVRPMFASLDHAAGNRSILFYGVLHPLLTTSAALLTQIVYARVKRAESAEEKFRRSVIGYSGCLFLLLLGYPWPGFIAG